MSISPQPPHPGHEPPVLVTGAAGFIGYYLAERLLQAGRPVVGIDNLNDYYDPALKEARLDRLRQHPGFRFERIDIADQRDMQDLFARLRPAIVAHMAAQAGVGYSMENPQAYGASNLAGFLNVLEGCRAVATRHLVYASSSSVYGGNARVPFSIHDSVDHPVSLYAATKKANELMAHSYAALYGLPMTGLRFFTVYGPWGRPDMAVWKFTRAILAGEPIRVNNHGRMWRDFTYIDDIAEAVVRLLDRPAEANPDFDRMAPDPGSSFAPHRVYNIGNRKPEALMELIGLIEAETGRKGILEMRPLPPGEVVTTSADTAELEAAIVFRPATPLADGIARFVRWYRDHHGI
ncbi:NAD-dependent epimerase [Limibaculum sp. FT325]|uniref:NAD-dependent epimerase n=1 Tax=Thermohalobaculum sediminis TaxID=2939436 RepID=UPI0020BF2076|nr:NAD-dependent epimerase [Limibaculum sediminis]MCL5778921.1 NAD-dependent epimerase [Limibaculum sediminis]